MKLASCKSALNPPVVYSTDRSKAVVPVLVLLFVALWFILRGDLFYALPCVILFLSFSVLLALRLPRLGEERANLSAFRTYVRFVLVWICRFPLPLNVWEGLLFVILIVALPGLFSYLFLYSTRRFVLFLNLCHFVLVFFSLFSIAITSLGEERANLSAFRTFVRFVLVLDLSVSSSSWCLGRAAVCDCGTSWTFLLPFFFKCGGCFVIICF